MRSICFLMEFRGDGYVHPVLTPVMRDLERRGWKVETRITENEPWLIEELPIEHDLYVLKSSSPMTDQLASLISANGGRTLNDVAAVQRIRNKVWTDKFLRDRGIPIPESYLAGAAGLVPILDGRGPLIIKPIDGRHGIGVRVVRDTDALDEVARDEAVYAQEFKSGDGFDRKIYVAGGEVWGARKAFAAGESYLQDALPFPIPPETRDLALRIGRLLGLEIFGVDMIDAVDGRWVVDVNGFPGFKGIPGAHTAIASYIDQRGRGLSRPQAALQRA